MADKIDGFLDGQLGDDALTPSQRADADAVVRAIQHSRSFLAQRSAPDVSANVMARIGAVGSPPARLQLSALERLAALLWTPRQLSLRPVYAVLTIAASMALVWLAAPARRTPPVNALSDAPRVFVQFRFDVADAMRVQLAGSFTNWQPTYELHQSAPGIWMTTVPLPEGVHDYSFIVDGQQWVADPYSAQISDGFGGTNSRLTLLVPDTPRS
jgi:hypothetical protein